MTTSTPAATPRAGRAEPLLRRLVGGILRERRESQGRTLRDVGRDARVSVAYLSEIERGRKEPSSEVLVAVCHALGMRLVDLLGEAYDALTPRGVVVDLAGRVPVGERGTGDAALELTGAGDAPERAPSPGTAVLRAA